jgi:tRNA1(Val) A37 N6-methylase TrmN6
MVEYLNQKIENRTLFSHDGTDATYFPQQMNDLCVKYLELKKTDTLLDLGSGVSSFLINAKKKYDVALAAGVEIDEEVYIFAKILSAINEEEIQVWNEDVFNFSKLKQVEKLFVLAYPHYKKQIIFTEFPVAKEIQDEFYDADVEFISINK